MSDSLQPTGSSVHGIFQARILEWMVISFSRGSSRPRDPTGVSYVEGGSFTWLSHQGITMFNQFSRSVVSISLGLHGLQHTRLPCPSTTPGAYSNSCPLSWWCHPAISSSVVPFTSCLQSFRASGSFQMSEFFTSGGQSIGVSASASVLPMNIQDWFPLGWTGWISFQSKGLSRVFPSTTVWKHQFFGAQPSLWFNSYLYMTTGKTIVSTVWTFVGKVMSLLFTHCLGLS